MAAVLPAIFNNYNTNIRLKITILNYKYYSNAQRFSILYWETQARIHWYWVSLRGRHKLNVCLYFPVQNKETFKVWLTNLLFAIFSFLFFSFFISYSAIGIRSRALTKWSHCKAMSFFLIFNFFLFVSRENSSFSLMSFNKFLANPGNKARILRFCTTT